MINTLTVVLEQDLPEDSAQLLATTINMLRGVLHVTTNKVEYEAAYATGVRIKDKVRIKLMRLVNEELRI